MKITFFKEKTIKIYLKDKDISSLQNAVQDLRNDFLNLGYQSELCYEEKEADILIYIDFTLTHDEEYLAYTDDNKIILKGQADLGTMWAIYTFSEKELKIPPFYLFEDLPIQKKETLVFKEFSYHDYPKIRYRGWFINDEDLLENYSHLGKRNINYRFYQRVISPSLMTKIVKTALRNKINLLIPSTIIDIKNPCENDLIKLISSYGLYVSQHHVQPLGVFADCFNRWAKNNNYSFQYSFITNKDILIECWKEYVKCWSQYPRVIYQLGLRGNSDMPAWASDPSFPTIKQERGKIISDAIKIQKDIVDSYTNGKGLTSTTLWMEGAELRKEGALEIPKDTIVVYSDIGGNQLFGDDFFRSAKIDTNPKGTYLHTQYWNIGPHLMEGEDPRRNNYCHNLAIENNLRDYSILNVGNIKEFTFAIYLDAINCFKGNEFNLEEEIKSYCTFYTLDNSFIYAIKHYFLSFGDGTISFFKKWCKDNDFCYHEYSDLEFPEFPLSDGYLSWYLCKPFADKVKTYDSLLLVSLQESKENMKKTLEEYKQISIPQENQAAFKMKWIYMADYWIDLVDAAIEETLALEEKVNGKQVDQTHYIRAIQYLNNIIEKRDNMLSCNWKNYYQGDKKINIPGIKKKLEDDLKGNKTICYYDLDTIRR